MARRQRKTFPSTLWSKAVPTEYDVRREGARYVLSDDRGRRFGAFTLKGAFRRAERAQDPRDPIHHEPFPHPEDTPLP